MKAPYRFPFDHQFLPQWNKVDSGGWDDPVAPLHGYWAYDFVFPEGTNIRAARSGVVYDMVDTRVKGPTDRDTGSGGGNFVLIRHSDNTVASYAHLMTKQVFVREGDYVAQGQVIAQSGFTGRTSEPHLHFQVMLWGQDELTSGPTIPVLFEDAVHDAWKPVAGDVHRSNNTVLRQDNWRWCHKCHLLFFAGGAPAPGEVGACPAGGGHDASASDGYVLAQSEPDHETQAGWRWCSRCSALFLGDTPPSHCPGHGSHDLVGSGPYFVRVGTRAPSEQPGWRWCANCHGLFLGGPGSVCATTGRPHSGAGSGPYTVQPVIDLHHVVQSGWRRCSKCQGMFFGEHPESTCPKDLQAHDGSQSLVYTLPLAGAHTLGQSGWRWCDKCQALFFGGTEGSRCPATGGPHSGSSSGDYVLHVDLPTAPGQRGWRWCHKCQGLFLGDNSGSVCPANGSHSQSGSGDYAIW